jgi:hypothetical protein
MIRRRSRRRSKIPPGTVNHFPTQPGWWVQWSGRTDWQPMDASSAILLKQIIVADGDKVVEIQRQDANNAQ